MSRSSLSYFVRVCQFSVSICGWFGHMVYDNTNLDFNLNLYVIDSFQRCPGAEIDICFIVISDKGCYKPKLLYQHTLNVYISELYKLLLNMQNLDKTHLIYLTFYRSVLEIKKNCQTWFFILKLGDFCQKMIYLKDISYDKLVINFCIYDGMGFDFKLFILHLLHRPGPSLSLTQSD